MCGLILVSCSLYYSTFASKIQHLIHLGTRQVSYLLYYLTQLLLTKIQKYNIRIEVRVSNHGITHPLKLWRGWVIMLADGLSNSSFLVWFSIAHRVCQRAVSLLAIWFLRPWARVLHSAEEDNLSPLDSNIACMCQIFEINRNKHIARARCEAQPAVGRVGWILADHVDGLSNSIMPILIHSKGQHWSYGMIE